VFQLCAAEVRLEQGRAAGKGKSREDETTSDNVETPDISRTSDEMDEANDKRWYTEQRLKCSCRSSIEVLFLALVSELV